MQLLWRSAQDVDDAELWDECTAVTADHRTNELHILKVGPEIKREQETSVYFEKGKSRTYIYRKVREDRAGFPFPAPFNSIWAASRS